MTEYMTALINIVLGAFAGLVLLSIISAAVLLVCECILPIIRNRGDK